MLALGIIRFVHRILLLHHPLFPLYHLYSRCLTELYFHLAVFHRNVHHQRHHCQLVKNCSLLASMPSAVAGAMLRPLPRQRAAVRSPLMRAETASDLLPRVNQTIC